MLYYIVNADGSALDKIAGFVEAQGGDKELVYHPEKLPQASADRVYRRTQSITALWKKSRSSRE